MKFRKRPVVVEAEQVQQREVIVTLEGIMTAEPGDWIITGVKGEKYPCKPDIFDMTYESVSENERHSDGGLKVTWDALKIIINNFNEWVSAKDWGSRSCGEYIIDKLKEKGVEVEEE